MDTRPDPESSGAQIGRYKLLEQIGEGGMGTVWMAEQREPVKRRVALKIIKLGMDTKQVIARFEAERQALALMDHPHIAKVLDAGSTETGRPYFVMEFIKGVPILEYCDQAKLDTQARLELFTSVCHAIQHAHHKGIIHRDIKPSNVLVTLHDGLPVPKVIDFGIAKATNSELTTKTLFTEHRQMIGTPAYMSPEQAEMSGLDIDTRSDVYSLGVLLYELLTGTTPFDTKALLESGYNEMLRAIREDEPHKPSTRVSSLGDTGTRTAQLRRVEQRRLSLLLRGDIDWIVMKSLEKDRTRRYETANGLAADVRRHLAGDAVLAAPSSASYRTRKFVRRHRVQVAAAALVTLALLLGLAGTVWQAGLASDRAARAKQAETDAKLARDAEKTRADELEKVSTFQEKMLAQVDSATAGVRLRADVNQRFDAALAKAQVPESERGAELASFRSAWAQVNTTDAAAALIDATILKPALKAIDEQFKGQPILDARLRRALAERYRDLGLYDTAHALMQTVLDTRRSVLREEDPETISAIADLGSLLQKQRKFAEAEPFLRDALEKYRRVQGDEHPHTLTMIGNMGLLLQQQGKLADAEPYCREALEQKRRVLREDDPSTISSLSNMGLLLQAQGKLAAAEPLLREALEKNRRVAGEEHPRTLTSMNNLAVLLRSERKLAKAEPYAREVVEKARRVLGEEHPDTLSWISNCAVLLGTQGKHAEAESLLAEALRTCERAFTSGQEVTALVLHHHADALRALGRLDEAATEARRAMDIYRNDPDKSSVEAADAAWIMSTVLRDQGQLPQAETCLRDALERYGSVLGEQDLQTHALLARLGEVLRAQGKFAAAELLCREVLEKRRRLLGDDDPSTLLAVNDMGFVLHEQHKLSEAAPYYREALEKRRRVLGDDDPATLISIGNMGTLFQDQEQLTEAEPLLREVLEKSRRVQGEEHRDTIRAVHNMAHLFLSQGKLSDAEACFREDLEKSRRVLGAANPDTLDTLHTLGVLLQTEGKLAEAEAVFAEGVATCQRAFAGPHATSAMLLQLHADVVRALGRLADAEAEVRTALEMYRDPRVWSQGWAVSAEVILISILKAQGKRDEALAVRREWLAVERRMLPPASDELASRFAALGSDLLERGTLADAREAEPLMRECLQIRSRTMRDDWRLPNTRSILGGAILLPAELDPELTPDARVARLRESEPLLLESYQGLKEREAAIPAEGKMRIPQASARVVHLYEVWDKIEPGQGYDAKAAEWKAKH